MPNRLLKEGIVDSSLIDSLTSEEEVLLTVATAALPSSGTVVVDLYYSAP